MPTRLKDPKIQGVPKKVQHAKSFRISVDLKRKAELFEALADIRNAIENGFTLPSGSYRANVLTTRDELLETHGIMHLHLGDENTRELLYLVQFPKRVVFLEVTDHIHFTTDPIGHLLLNHHGKTVAELSAQFEAEDAAALADKTAKIRGSLLRRSSQE